MSIKEQNVEVAEPHWREKAKKDWPMRLKVCSEQAEIALRLNDIVFAEYWIVEGYEAVERCAMLMNSEACNEHRKNIINSYIRNFKSIVK